MRSSTPTFSLFPYTTLFRSCDVKPSDRPCIPSSFLVCGCARWCTSTSHDPPGPSRSAPSGPSARRRSEEHTSELQSHSDLVCRLLLEKKKKFYGREITSEYA